MNKREQAACELIRKQLNSTLQSVIDNGPSSPYGNWAWDDGEDGLDYLLPLVRQIGRLLVQPAVTESSRSQPRASTPRSLVTTIPRKQSYS